MNLKGCNALITGASAGIGREFARQLAPIASSVILVARRLERLEELREEFRRSHPDLRVHIHAADLSKHDDVNQLGDWLEQERSVVDFLINNAGSGDRGTVATSDPTRVLEMLEVNVVTLTMLTRRLLPAMIAQKRGAILNVSSSASFMPMPGFAIYAASKAYVTSLSEALRGELRDSGITVTALCPGPVRTEFNSIAQRSDAWKGEVPEFVYVDVADVVRGALEAVEHDRAQNIPGLAMKIGMFLVRLTPMPILRLAWRFGK